MTNQEAINKLTAVLNDDIYSWSPAILTAFGMAVDALKGAEGDLISRKAAIDRIESHIRTGDELYPLTDTDKILNHGFEIAASCVYNLSSVQPSFPQRHENDCVSRADVNRVIEDWFRTVFGTDSFRKTGLCRELRELPSAQPERLTDDDFETIRIHLSIYKEKLCNQRRWKEAEEYQKIIDRFMSFASVQSELIRCKDCKHYRALHDQDDLCVYTMTSVEADDYCSYAERRTDDT